MWFDSNIEIFILHNKETTMKQIEIKRFDPLNVGKVTVYMMAIPAVICFLIGLVLIPLGIFFHHKQNIIMGIIICFGYPVLFIVVYGLMGIVQAYLYNWFSKKYGGLTIQVDEKNIDQVS